MALASVFVNIDVLLILVTVATGAALEVDAHHKTLVGAAGVLALRLLLVAAVVLDFALVNV